MENINFTCNTLEIYSIMLQWRCTKLNRNVLIIYRQIAFIEMHTVAQAINIRLIIEAFVALISKSLSCILN